MDSLPLIDRSQVSQMNWDEWKWHCQIKLGWSGQGGFTGIYDASQISRQIVHVELRGFALFALSTLQRDRSKCALKLNRATALTEWRQLLSALIKAAPAIRCEFSFVWQQQPAPYANFLECLFNRILRLKFNQKTKK